MTLAKEAAPLLRPYITEKGLAAASQAATLGKAVKITKVGLTASGGTASPGDTSLPGARFVNVADGRVVSEKQVNISALLPDTFPSMKIAGVAFYLEDDTMFAVYRENQPFLEHTTGTTMLVGMDFAMDNIPSESVIVESTGANLILGDWVPIQRKICGKQLTADIYLTADDVKALSTEKGGSVSGSVVVSGQVTARASNGFQTVKDSAGMNASLSSEANYVMLWRRNGQSGVKADEFIGIDQLSNLRFRQDNGAGDGKYKDQYVYHTGNKPTASDVGALPTTNPYATGNLSIASHSSHVRLVESDNDNKRWDVEVNNLEFRIVEAGVATRLVLRPGGGLNLSGVLRVVGEIQSKSTQSYRMSDGVIGTFWRKDGDNLYLMRTQEGEAESGSYSEHRPLSMALKTGKMSVGNGLRVVGDLEMASALVMGTRYLKGHNDSIVLRDHGMGTVTLSGGRNEDGSPGDLVLGYNATASGTNGYNTKSVRLASRMTANNGIELISGDGKINGDELGYGAFQVLTDGNGVKHTVVGGADSVNRGRTIVASGEAGKQVADNNQTGLEDLHLASDTADMWLHTGLNSEWGGSSHRKVRVKDGELYAQGDQKVYHPKNKPTPSDLGVLASTGGKLTGSLEIATGAPILKLTETDQEGQKPYMLVVDGGSVRLNVNSTSALDADVVWKWNDVTKEFYTPGKLTAMGGLYDGSKRAYSENNKPTAADVGALPIKGGTLEGTLSLAAGYLIQHMGLTADNKQLLSAHSDKVYFGNRTGVAQAFIQTISGEAYVSAGEANYRVYHAGYKPTATDVGAVPKSEVNYATTGGLSEIANKIPRVKSDGVMEIGSHLDFHVKDSVSDYDVRLSASGRDLTLSAEKVITSGSLQVTGPLYAGGSAQVGGYILNAKADDNLLYEMHQLGHSAAMMYKPKGKKALRFCGSNGSGGETEPWLEMDSGQVTTLAGVQLKEVGARVYSANNEPHHTHNHTAAQGNQDVVAGAHSAIGAYVFAAAINGAGQHTHGQLASGSELRPCSAAEWGYAAYSLPGSWRCMGDISGSNSDDRLDDRSTLWLRVA